MRYVYLGTPLTDPALVGRHCDPVLRADGRCIVGRGSQLVRFEGEQLPRVVSRRRLRLRGKFDAAHAVIDLMGRLQHALKPDRR